MNPKSKHVVLAAEADDKGFSECPTQRLIQAAKSIVEFESDQDGQRAPVRKSSLTELLAGGAPAEGAVALRLRSQGQNAQEHAGIFPLKPPSKARSKKER